MSKIEIDLSKHAGGFMHLVAVPETALDLRITEGSLEGTTLHLVIEGTARNFPNSEPTSCSLTWIIEGSDGQQKKSAGGTCSMEVSGSDARVEVDLDLIRHGLFGRGRLGFEITPDFPPYEVHRAAPSYAYDYECDVTPEGLSGTSLSGTLRVGALVRMTPRLHSALGEQTLRVRISEIDEDEPEEAEGAPKAFEMAFVWEPGDSEPKTWRVGCAEATGGPLLNYLEAEEEGDYEVEIAVEIEGEGGQFGTVRSGQVRVVRPSLTAFALRCDNEAYQRIGWSDLDAAWRWLSSQPERRDLHVYAEGQVSGLAPGFPFPLEVSLFGHTPFAHDCTDLRVMAPLTTPVRGQVDAAGRFSISLLNLSTIRDQRKLSALLGQSLFGVLRLPSGATAGGSNSPVGQALRYDSSTFQPLMGDDLPPEIRGGGEQQQRTGLPIEALATGVCSSDLGGVRPTRMPRFGQLGFGVRGENLLVSCPGLGDATYWEEAEPKITLTPEGGSPIEMSTARSADDPRAFEATMRLNDSKILGKCIDAKIQVGNADARLHGEVAVDPPPPSSASLTCSPALGPISLSIEEQNGQRIGRIRCATRYFPTFPGASKGLRFRFYGYYQGFTDPVEMSPKVRYAIPDGSSGTDGRAASPSGILEAFVEDQADLDRLAAGKLRVEVYRFHGKGKVLGIEVPAHTEEVGRGARAVPSGQIIFRSKVSEQFKTNLLLIAQELNLEANHLMACMAFETGEKFLPGYYKSSGAVGLIQFTTDGAKATGKTKAELSKMTAEDQLFCVRDYFQAWKDRGKTITSIEDIYMCIFCPKGIGMPNEYVLYSEEQDRTDKVSYYAKNKGLDQNDDKTITKWEAAVKVREKFEKGLGDLG